MKDRSGSSALTAASCLLLGALTLIRGVSLPESDIFFAIHHGQDILAGGSIVAPDRWNFFTAGQPWQSNSWLWDVALAAVYNAGGLIAIAALNAATFAITLAAAWSIAKAAGLSPHRRAGTTLALAAAIISFFTARAVGLDILLTLAFAWGLTRLPRSWRFGLRLLATVALAFVIAALGMNLHLSGPIYCLLLPAAAVLLSEDGLRRRALTFSAVALAAAIGVTCTPYGLGALVKAGQVADASRRLIVEWNPPAADTFLGWLVLVICATCIPLIIWLGRNRHVASLLLTAGLLLATLEAIRFVIYLTLVAFLLTCCYGGNWLWRHRDSAARSLTVANGRLVIGFSAFITACCAVVMLASWADGGPALAGVQPHDFQPFAPHSRVLSSPFDGSVISFYRRDVQVAIDGRNDLLGSRRYGEVTYTFAYAPVPELKAWLATNRVDGIYVSYPELSALKGRFDQLGWTGTPGRYGVAYTR